MSSTEPPEPTRPRDPEPTRDTSGGTAESVRPAATDGTGDTVPTASTTEHAEGSAAHRGEPIGAPVGSGRGRLGGFGRGVEGPGGGRRWPWIVGGVVVVVVAMLIGAAVTLGVLHHHARGHGRFAAGPGVEGRAWGPGEHQGVGHRGQFGGRHGGTGALGPGGQPGTTVLLGAVSSVNGANLVLTPDAAPAPVTVTTTDRTRVAGGQVRALSDLKAGDRVAVRVAPDHSAYGVMLIQASVRGTVTTLSGTSATVVQPDGLPQTVDTSGLPTQPQVGDRVAVTGTASGTTVKAQNLRELPKTG